MRTPEQEQEAYARLGHWLRDVRSARGFTQATVATVAVLSESRVRQIETARMARPPAATLRKLEAALGVPRGAADAVLAGLPSGVDLDELPPITVEDEAGGQRVVYAGKVDVTRLREAADQLARKYAPSSV